jgi:hypothetical protein
MLNQKTSSETKEKYTSELRLGNRLKNMEAERNKLNAKINKLIDERNRLIDERNQAYNLITILLSIPAIRNDAELQNKIHPYKNIIEKCTV